MAEKQAGLTALSMAYARGYHATHDAHKIFDDFLASALFTPEEHIQYETNLSSMLQYIAPEMAATNPDPQTALAWVVQLTNGPITLGRSRYTEDSLEAAVQNGARQYVILGAGLDTFAYRMAVRHPELAERLQVFELDHPATQAIKRERVAAAGWSHPENLHFIAVDFAAESISDALKRSAYNPSLVSFFSWLGVSYYLTREVVFETLRAIAANAAVGSTVVFDYLDREAFDPAKAGKLIQMMQYMAVQLGEPMKSSFDPRTLASELLGTGLRLEENLNPAEIDGRYFRAPDGSPRSDRYRAVAHFHYAKALVEKG